MSHPPRPASAPGAGPSPVPSDPLLAIVATPIGNLGDLSPRAAEALARADVVAAEDTRVSVRLLQHLGLRKPMVSLHEHNEARRTADLLARLGSGTRVALVTDAGTPGLSDPGRRLVRACAERAIPYTVIAGPSALTAALAGSGFDANRFHFGGFIPPRAGGRDRELRRAIARPETTVFFEAPHRLLRTLELLARIAPGRRACVCREMTKRFEEFRRAPAAELLAHYLAHPPRGEITLVVSGAAEREPPSPLTADPGEVTIAGA